MIRSVVEWYLVNINIAGIPHQSGWHFFGILYQTPVVIVLSLIVSFIVGFLFKTNRRIVFLWSSFIIIVVWESIMWIPRTEIHDYYIERERDGYWEFYHENGGLKSKGNYKDGLKVGVWEHFYENGNTKDLWDYGDDRIYWTHKAFRETGELLWEKNFFYGDLHGPWLSYFQDGNIRIKSDWEHGKELNQIRFRYFEDGRLMGRAEFKGDNFNGIREEFHENGQLKLIGTFKDGKPIGIWKEFDEEGNLTRSEEF